MRECVVPVVKRIGAGLFDSATTDLPEFVNCREKFKTIAKIVEKQNLGNQIKSGSKLVDSFL